MKQLEIGHQHGQKDLIRTMVWRDENFGISQCNFNGSSAWFEAYRIKKNSAYEAFGKQFEESESIPTDREWGVDSRTLKTFGAAKKAIEAMREKFLNKMQKTA